MVGQPMTYFLQRQDGLVKIGYSTNIPERKASLEIGSGPLVLLGMINGGAEVEKELHKHFAHARMFGEWFKLTKNLAEYLNSLVRTQL